MQAITKDYVHKDVYCSGMYDYSVASITGDLLRVWMLQNAKLLQI